MIEWLNWIFDNLPNIYAGYNLLKELAKMIQEVKKYKKIGSPKTKHYRK